MPELCSTARKFGLHKKDNRMQVPVRTGVNLRRRHNEENNESYLIYPHQLSVYKIHHEKDSRVFFLFFKYFTVVFLLLADTASVY